MSLLSILYPRTDSRYDEYVGRFSELTLRSQ